MILISLISEFYGDKLIGSSIRIFMAMRSADESLLRQKKLGKAKTEEGKKSVPEGVPKSLPALVKTSRIPR